MRLSVGQAEPAGVWCVEIAMHPAPLLGFGVGMEGERVGKQRWWQRRKGELDLLDYRYLPITCF